MHTFPFELKKQILLTGAGFTSNFGGFLAAQLGLKAANYIDQSDNIKRLIFENPANFENIYEAVFYTQPAKFTESERIDFQQAIQKAYRDLDRIICQFGPRGRSGYGLFYGNFSIFLAGSFAGSNSGPRGAIFTLNHDLFFERTNGFKAPMMAQTAARLHNDWTPLEARFAETLPNKEQIAENISAYASGSSPVNFGNDGDTFYFKLHGSYDWRSSDGRELMVIAGPKLKQLKEEPLLDWYHNCFKQALLRDDIKLLITGYSFQDDYLNEILAEAIDKNGLKFCILTPSNHIDGQLKNIGKNGLTAGLHKVFPYSLGQLFPEDQSTSTHLAEVLEVFPNNR